MSIGKLMKSMFFIFALSLTMPAYASFVVAHAKQQTLIEYVINEVVVKLSISTHENPEASLDIGGEVIVVDISEFSEFQNIDVHNVHLASDGYNSSTLVVIFECANEEGEESGDVRVIIKNHQVTHTQINECS